MHSSISDDGQGVGNRVGVELVAADVSLNHQVAGKHWVQGNDDTVERICPLVGLGFDRSLSVRANGDEDLAANLLLNNQVADRIGPLPIHASPQSESAKQPGILVTSDNGNGMSMSSPDGQDSDDSRCSETSITVVEVRIGKGKDSGAHHVSQPPTKANPPVPHLIAEVEIKRSFHWSFEHGGPLRPHGGVDHRQGSVISSFIARFPHLKQHFQRYYPKSLVNVNHPALRFTARNLGVQYLVVKSDEHRAQFHQFCQQQSVVAIDTESAPLSQYIDLVQISNGDFAYVCPLRLQDPWYLKTIANTLLRDSKKRLLQFGHDDVDKFVRALNIHIDIQCSVIDVQERLRKQAKLSKSPSLIDEVESRIYSNEKRILSKAWRISGWNNDPLHPEQEEYAALDAIFAFRLGCQMQME